MNGYWDKNVFLIVEMVNSNLKDTVNHVNLNVKLAYQILNAINVIKEFTLKKNTVLEIAHLGIT